MNTKKNTFITLVITLIATLTGCNKEFDLDHVVAPSQKIVVFGFISPSHDTIKVEVTRLAHLNEIDSCKNLDRRKLIIPNAIVKIRNEKLTKQLHFNANTGNYYLPAKEMPIISGSEYSLEVHAEGFKSIHAETKVPLKDTIIMHPEYIEKLSLYDYNMNFRFNDIPGSKNFYHLFASNDCGNGMGITDLHFEKDEKFQGLEMFFDTYINPNKYLHSILLTDEKIDGHTINIKCNVSSFSGTNPNKITFFLLSTDQYYYDYHKHLMLHDPGNTFAEPRNIKSNVINGVGVFASYNLYTKEFIFDRKD